MPHRPQAVPLWDPASEELCPLPRSGLGLRELFTVPLGMAPSDCSQPLEPTVLGRTWGCYEATAGWPPTSAPLPLRGPRRPGAFTTRLRSGEDSAPPGTRGLSLVSSSRLDQCWPPSPLSRGQGGVEQGPLDLQGFPPGRPISPQGPRRRAQHPAPPERPRTRAPAQPRPGSPGPAGASAALSAAGLSRPSISALRVPGAANAPTLPPARGARVRCGAPPARPTRPRSWPTWPRVGRAEFAQVGLDDAWGGGGGARGAGPGRPGSWGAGA